MKLELKDLEGLNRLQRLEKYLELAKTHQKHDLFVQENWLGEEIQECGLYKGCFFGCLNQGDSREVLYISAGGMQTPKDLIDLMERFFERLPTKKKYVS